MFYSGLTDSDEDDAWVCQNCTETSNIDNTCSECGRARTAAEEVSSTITSVSAEPSVFSSMRNRTGYVYESVCEMHEEIKAPGSDAIHPERPARTRAIHARLEAQGSTGRWPPSHSEERPSRAIATTAIQNARVGTVTVATMTEQQLAIAGGGAEPTTSPMPASISGALGAT